MEQAVDDARPNRGVTPLPNLEMKFVAANALGLVASGQGQLRDPAIVTLEAERQEVNAAFFSARNRRAKQAARKRILEIREELGALLAASGFPAEDARALAAWDPFDANAAARFFDPEWMFGLGDHHGAGFDIVMANPPYVRQEKIESYLLDGRPANVKSRLAADYATAAGTADLLVYFFERAVRLLRPGGSRRLHHVQQVVPRGIWRETASVVERGDAAARCDRLRGRRGVRGHRLSDHCGGAKTHDTARAGRERNLPCARLDAGRGARRFPGKVRGGELYSFSS